MFRRGDVRGRKPQRMSRATAPTMPIAKTITSVYVSDARIFPTKISPRLRERVRIVFSVLFSGFRTTLCRRRRAQ